ncbi:MAG TPA: hypothetical protein VE868_08810 [Balneolaceae bacterium]|nr:hypothetical protein [Balneolaceae bacterium]
MKYLICLFTYLFAVTFVVAAQDNNTLTREEMHRISQDIHSGGITVKHANDYRGSPYFAKWQKGYIILKGGAKSNTLPIRYNMQKNAVEYIKNKKRFIISAKKIDGFVIKEKNGNITFKNGFKTNQGHINQNTLLRVIYNGNTKLLAHYTSKLLKNLASYESADTKNRFDNHIRYYIQESDGTFQKVKLKKKDILNALRKNRKKVAQYANKHNLSFKKETDLKDILKYYDSINSAS